MCCCCTLSLPVPQLLLRAARSSDRCHRTYFILFLSSEGNSQNFHLGARIRFCAEQHSVIMIYDGVFRRRILNILLTNSKFLKTVVCRFQKYHPPAEEINTEDRHQKDVICIAKNWDFWVCLPAPKCCSYIQLYFLYLPWWASLSDHIPIYIKVPLFWHSLFFISNEPFLPCEFRPRAAIRTLNHLPKYVLKMFNCCGFYKNLMGRSLIQKL